MGSCWLRMVAVLVVFTLVSCSGEEEQFRKETSPVVGQVKVDGQAPSSQISVKCHSVSGLDKEHPTLSSAFTTEEGKFEIATYESGDGVPAGDYVLTFYWGELNLISASYGGKDKLKNKYRNPKKSTTKFTVVEGEPTDLGVIELTTKK